MTSFNPLAPANDRENYAPREGESEDAPPPPPSRPVVPEPGFEIVTDGSVLQDRQHVRVWRGSRWRSAEIRGKVLNGIASVVFIAGGSGTPHISRIAIRTGRKPDADLSHPLLVAAVAERNKHAEKGWTAEHDDQHGSGHLRSIAAGYLSVPSSEPGSVRERLVATVALCLAEWDRDARERGR